jgi:hypothetical protein
VQPALESTSKIQLGHRELGNLDKYESVGFEVEACSATYQILVSASRSCAHQLRCGRAPKAPVTLGRLTPRHGALEPSTTPIFLDGPALLPKSSTSLPLGLFTPIS